MTLKRILVVNVNWRGRGFVSRFKALKQNYPGQRLSVWLCRGLKILNFVRAG